jgi:hypothetical protein
MRSKFILAAFGAMACGDQKFTAVNAEPDVDITSHTNGDEVGEGQATLFVGVVDDADDPESELLATWTAGERVVCERLPVTDWGETTCEMSLHMRETDVSLFVEDPRGSTGGDGVRLNVLATDAPSVEMLSPTEEGRYYSDHPVHLEALASDAEDFAVDLHVEWVGEEAGALDVPANPDSDGFIRDTANLSEGTHNLRVTVTDTSGKFGDDVVQIDVSGPNRAPSCEWLAPSDGTVLVWGEPVTLSGSVSDPDVPADWLTVQWSSDRQGALGTSTPGSDGVVSLTASGLEKAAHTLTLTAVDEVGASCTAERALVVTARPAVSIVRPVGEVLYYSDHPVSLEGTVVDEEDAPDSLSAQWESDAAGVLPIAGDVSFEGLSVGDAWLASGVHILTLTGTDADGISATDSSAITVRGPNQVPTCSLLSPVSGAGGDEAATVALSGAVGDADVGPEALSVEWVSDRDGTLGFSTPGSDGSASMTAGGMTVGTHTISMVVTDEVGASCVDNTDFTVGRAPLVSIGSPVDGSTVNQGQTVTFLGTVSDPDESATGLAVAWESDRDGALHEASPDSSGLSVFTAGSLTVGVHTITLSATDSLGLHATAVAVLTVNGLPTAPSIRITPDPARTTDSLGVVFDVASVDPEGDAITHRFEWFQDGVPMGEMGTVGSALTAKDQTWEVRVTPMDAGGDGASATAARLIVNSTPVIDSVVIGPDPLTTNEDAVADIAVSDPDGDAVTFIHEWTVDGATRGDSSASLSGEEHFDKHQLVVVRAMPMDEESSGEWVTADPVWVQNSVPTAPTIELVPDAPVGGVDPIWCRVREDGVDADGDPIHYSVAWERDAYPYPDVESEDTGMGWVGPLTDDWGGDTVPASDTVPGELWECAVTSWDDEEAGETAVSAVELESVPPGCGDGIVQPGEEVDPPISPFTELSIDPETCRWDFSEVEQLYCYGMCSWAGPPGCDEADADVLCKLIMDNPASEHISYSVTAPLSEAGFPGVYCGYGTMIDTDRGVPDVSWMDASLAAHHGGGGTVIAFPVCTDP